MGYKKGLQQILRNIAFHLKKQLDQIRIISARKATKTEEQKYEERIRFFKS